jgi:glyoxylase-like metal-dependent hydrolase (beta-lactamase superfamily II)
MQPRTIAPGVQIFPLSPFDTINAYMVEDVLIDAGTRRDAKKLKRMIGDQPISSHALTHVHPDHQGSSAAICKHYGIELQAPAGEVEDMEAGVFSGPARNIPTWFMRVSSAGPGHPVARALVPGDDVAGFTVVASPGHSPDHVCFWRESDGVLIAGDAFRNMSYMTYGPKLDLPWHGFSTDQDQARESAIELIKLRPSLVAFGHGSPVKGEKFLRGMDKLGLV